MKTKNYQLTSYPIGSLREIFFVSWPLIAGLLSGSIMMFADRVFLANYDLAALNASANAGMAFFAMIILPMVIAGMSEVFVGRLNGEGQQQRIGLSVWQMIWFSLMTIPLFSWGGRLLSPFFAYGSINFDLESEYFILSCDFGVFWVLSSALMGFYIGLGHSRIVMLATFIANLINVLFDYLLIFGIGPFPELGIKGAALATGAAAVFQCAFFTVGFLSTKNKTVFGTHYCHFDKNLFLETIRIGVPAGMGRFVEVVAHAVFFRLVSYSGELQLTIVALVQSIYILFSFSSEGLCKAVTAIASNLIGARKLSLIGKVIRSAMIQHTIITVCFSVLLFFNVNEVISLFIPKAEIHLLENQEFIDATLKALFWMGIFFLMDGLSWTIVGHLMAAGDTKFIFWAAVIMNWVAYVLPVAFGITYLGWGAQEAWLVIAFASCLLFAIVTWRYLSKRWVVALAKTERELEQDYLSTAAYRKD
ncbi:MAG: MATE family efflux transporter [Parachlamydiaceae bacterium]